MFSIKILETLIECCATANAVYKQRTVQANEASSESIDSELREALQVVADRNEHKRYNAAEASHMLKQMLEQAKAKCEEKQP